MLDKTIKNEYLQWLRSKGKSEQGLTNVFVNNNGNVTTEKRMAEIVHNTPEDWKEFCKETGREYEGEICLLAIY